MFNSEILIYCLWNKNCTSHLCRKRISENKQFLKNENMDINSFLTRQEYHFTSINNYVSIPIFFGERCILNLAKIWTVLKTYLHFSKCLFQSRQKFKRTLVLLELTRNTPPNIFTNKFSILNPLKKIKCMKRKNNV